MKIKKSFFIRWLMTRDNTQNEKFVFDIEHVQSGDKHRVSSFDEAQEWMKQAGTMQAENAIDSADDI
jgi:hypothetical protein